jgi:phage-related protein (TIGR01555 family)
LLRPTAAPEPTPEKRREPIVFSERTLEKLRERDAVNRERLFRPAPPPDIAMGGNKAAEARALANDDALGNLTSFGISNGGIGWGAGTGLVWLGYPYLAELAQRPEYRIIVELFANEMTRKWIKFKSTGDDDKTEKIKELEAELRRFRLREHFRDAKRDDGYFGMGQLYVQIAGVEDNPELLRAPLIVDSRTIKKGALRGFKKIEPYWIYPQAYNSNNPLRDDFFVPTLWTVMGSTIHASRLLTFIGNPVPDILKAAYSFGGISVIQLMKPYVDAFLRTKNSVNELISAFSTMVLQTNMSAFLTENAARSLEDRIEAFNLMRDNFGTMTVDKDTEDLKNVSAPLAGLDELQAQAEEHMLIPMRAPLLKAFGLSPSGLNASQEDEIRSFYDNVNSDQENQYRRPLDTAIKIIQLNKWGEIDPEIDFDFVPLWQLDEAGEAAVEKTKSDIDLQNIEMGAIAPNDVRKRLAGDPKSPYHGLDLGEDAPGTLDVDGEGKPINDPLEREVDAGGVRGSTGGANSGV